MTNTLVTIDDGFYTVSDLNNFIKRKMVNMKYYMIDSSGNFVYFLEIVTNPTYYANQIICYSVPTAAQIGALGYTVPAGYSHGPSAFCPILISPEGLGKFLGFLPAQYPTGATVGNLDFLSNIIPLGSTVNSVAIRCNIINNKLSSPSDVLDSIPINSIFGSNINYLPNFERWISLSQGTYSSIEISLQDQNFNALPMTDSESIITLMIRQ